MISFNELLHIATSMLRGLAFLHEEKHENGLVKPAIVHRDFKSSEFIYHYYYFRIFNIFVFLNSFVVDIFVFISMSRVSEIITFGHAHGLVFFGMCCRIISFPFLLAHGFSLAEAYKKM